MWLLIRSTLAAAPFIFTPDVNHMPPPLMSTTDSVGGTAAALSRQTSGSSRRRGAARCCTCGTCRRGKWGSSGKSTRSP